MWLMCRVGKFKEGFQQGVLVHSQRSWPVHGWTVPWKVWGKDAKAWNSTINQELIQLLRGRRGADHGEPTGKIRVLVMWALRMSGKGSCT
eukprot:7253129-Ditylum_brightwellii.AAC.1